MILHNTINTRMTLSNGWRAGCMLLMTLLFACNADEPLKYSSADNVYFGSSKEVGLSEEEIKDKKLDKRDSVLSYTFALTPEKTTDTVYVPVSLSGTRVHHDRKFKVVVTSKKTTAESSVHYQPLLESYTLPADSGQTWVPVILYNTDAKLDSQSLFINLKLASTEDFSVDVARKSETAIMFSNRLEKPLWWTLWQGELASYSRTKHALYIIAVGNIDLVANYDGENQYQIPYNLYLIEKLKALLVFPFDWVAENDKGYVLTDNGDDTFFLHTEANPAKKYLLKKSQEDGEYYFIDEKGKPITINH
ncbi:DUF4843 domain-containing protein [Chryseolinea lacunae]|uniref:DUF4843 domain-containing protein n=1 Tax=Chryseolinea lacunae TaxID=2801331 RepID=A0ABS1KU87_9BACT|nr:DUF4843 domain-containing protein [Chryseolinea lacunae]MBL0742995.1 DUF4843 domain-containing protein [Chryseolinea lacunae]